MDCCNTIRAQELGMKPVAYRTFCRLWTQQLGYIKIGKPQSDLCWTCQQNSLAMMKMVNMMDRETDKVLYTWQNSNIRNNQNWPISWRSHKQYNPKKQTTKEIPKYYVLR